MNTVDIINSLPATPETLSEAITKINEVHKMVSSLLAKSEDAQNREASETYLNVKQVAELTHYSEQTVRTKTMLGDIPSFKMNGKRLFRKSSVLQWISNGGR